MEEILQLTDVTVGFPAKFNPLFKVGKLELSVGQTGTVLCVLGSTGCGKSTLLKLFARLLPPLHYNGDVQINNCTLSYLPQTPVIFPEFTAYQNAAYLSTLRNFKNCSTAILVEVDRLGKLMRLDWNRLNRTPSHSWSGGEVQRICLVRALSTKPKLLLMDEPCTGLDVMVRRELLGSIRQEAIKNKTTVIYVTHHGDEVLWIADYLIVFKEALGQRWKFETEFITLESALHQPPTPDVRIHLTPFTNVAFGKNGESANLLFPPDAVVPCSDSSVITKRMKLGADCCLIDLVDGTRLVAGMSSELGTNVGVKCNPERAYRY